MPRGTKLQLRRDSAANWASVNPVLADGEPGWDETNHILRIGDGATTWNSLGVLTPTPTSIDIPAEVMRYSGAALSIDGIAFAPVGLFDAAATETAAAHATLPDTWATFDVVARMANAAASSGDVRLSVVVVTLETDSVPVSASAVLTTVAASTTQWETFEATLQVGVAVSTEKQIAIRFARNGGDGADTLANDLALLSIRLIRAS